MKIVIDTNVLLSAFLFRGLSAEIYDHAWKYHTIFLSSWILDEFANVSRKKLKLPKSDLEGIIKHITAGVHLVEPEEAVPDICRDKDDNNILLLAESVKADCIITGDQDLLVIKKYKKTGIISPKEYRTNYMKE